MEAVSLPAVGCMCEVCRSIHYRMLLRVFCVRVRGSRFPGEALTRIHETNHQHHLATTVGRALLRAGLACVRIWSCSSDIAIAVQLQFTGSITHFLQLAKQVAKCQSHTEVELPPAYLSCRIDVRLIGYLGGVTG